MSMPVPADAPVPAEPRSGRTVLLTAATVWEERALARSLSLGPDGPGRWKGRAGARPLFLLKTGMGEKATRAALDGRLAPSDYGLAISAGLCGALQPELKAGDIVVDPAGAEMDLVVPARETAKALDLPFHFGAMLHANKVLQPEAKAALGREHRRAAVDMETAAVRRWAEGSGLPVLAVRAVLDEVHEALPADAPEGEDALSLARYAAAHAAELPKLVSIGLRSGRAMKGLGRFLKAYLEALPA